MRMRLQQYEDGTFGYLGIDGDLIHKFQNDSSVLCTQEEDEDREDFISKNDIIFRKNQYGSNEVLDEQVNDEDEMVRCEVAEQGYGLDKLIYDENYAVRCNVAEKGYGLNIILENEDCIDKTMVYGAIKSNRFDIIEKFLNSDDDNTRQAVTDCLAEPIYEFDENQILEILELGFNKACEVIDEDDMVQIDLEDEEEEAIKKNNIHYILNDYTSDFAIVMILAMKSRHLDDLCNRYSYYSFLTNLAKFVIALNKGEKS